MNKLVIVFAILLVAASARTTAFTCGDGFQKSPNGQMCEPCRDTNCKNCAGDYKTCATCKTGFAIINGACVACPAGVKECCAVEKDSKALKAISCNDGYTLLGSVCVETLENCMERDPTSLMCKTCANGYWLNNVTGANSKNVCALGKQAGCSKYYNEKNCQTCDSKFYRALITTDSETTYYGCNPCTSDCICSTETDKCTACANPNLFIKVGSQCNACSTVDQKCSKCADKVGCTECPALFQKIPDSSKSGESKCVAFPANCEAVDSSKLGETLSCTTCMDGFFLETSDGKGICTPCTSGNNNTGIKLCNALGQAMQCLDPPQTPTANAYPRIDAYRLVNSGDGQKKCAKITINTNNDSNQCWEIIDGSLTEINDNRNCKNCYEAEGFFLVPNTAAGDKKAKCVQRAIAGCKEYMLNTEQTEFICKTCMNNSDVMDSNYVVSPPEGGKSCNKCDSRAKTCSDVNTITACIMGFYLKDKACVACDPNKCAVCGNDGKCTQCIAGYALETANNTSQCLACTLNCVKCSKRDTCDTCGANFFLDPTSQFCSPMRPNCVAFEPSGGVCKRCKYGYDLINGWCLRCTDLSFPAETVFEGFYSMERCKKIADTASCSTTIAPPTPGPGPNPTPDTNKTPTNGTSASTSGTETPPATTSGNFSQLISFSVAAILSVFFIIL